METKNVMIVGVGGQGSLLASKLLGALLVAEGYDVKVSEVHGMSQRGGSVVTYVRFGDNVYSPVIAQGEADFIVSFEKIEAARYAANLRKDGKIIVNSQMIDPMPVITGAAQYPENVLDELRDKGVFVDEIDALSLAQQAGNAKSVNIVLMGRLAQQAGNAKSVNIVLMGRLAKYFHIEEEKWIEAIKNTVKPQFVEVNLKAFELGYNF